MRCTPADLGRYSNAPSKIRPRSKEAWACPQMSNRYFSIQWNCHRKLHRALIPALGISAPLGVNKGYRQRTSLF